MEMYGSMRGRGQSKGFMVEAISGVDIGLEDPIGKALDQSIHCLLECSLPVLWRLSPPIPLKGQEGMVKEARGLSDSGFRAIELAIG